MESAVHGSDRNAQPLRYLFDADRLEIWRNSRRAVVFRHAATLAILASIAVFFQRTPCTFTEATGGARGFQANASRSQPGSLKRPTPPGDRARPDPEKRPERSSCPQRRITWGYAPQKAQAVLL